MTDWVVTLPQTNEWEDYAKEIEAVKDGKQVMNYRLPFKSKARPNDRCFICWRGKVRGWMRITDTRWYPGGFVCQTSGKLWPRGFYLMRSGPFYALDGPEMKGFRGIRRIEGMGGFTPRQGVSKISRARFV